LPPRLKPRIHLLLVALVFFGPLLLAAIAYYGPWDWAPRAAHGELIEPPLPLPAGASRVSIGIDTAAVRRRYQRVVLDGGGGVRVDEEFELRLTLRPILTEDEARRLPDGRVREVERGDSDLVSAERAAIPVRFELP